MRKTVIISCLLGLLFFIQSCSILSNKKSVESKKEKDNVVYVVQPVILSDAIEKKFVILTNNYRFVNGLDKLPVDALTNKVCLTRVLGMIDAELISHAGAGEAFETLRQAGADTFGEALGYGYRDAGGFFYSFTMSESHNRLLLSKNADWIGVSARKDTKDKWVLCVILGNENSM